MSEARAFAFRERALQAHKKALRSGIPEESRRAWLIVERDWARMAEREEVKVDNAMSQHPRGGASAGWRELEADVCDRQAKAGDARLAIKKLSIDEWWPDPT